MTGALWSSAIQAAADEHYKEVCDRVSAKDGDPLHKEYLKYTGGVYVKDARVDMQGGLGGLGGYGKMASTLSVRRDLRYLADMAMKGSTGAYEICQLITWSHIHNGVALPEDVREVAAMLCAGIIKEPKTNGRMARRQSNTRRDRLIIEMMFFLMEVHGLKVARNEATQHEGSASDYISRCMIVDYPEITYEKIASVWSKDRGEVKRKWARMTMEERDAHWTRVVEMKEKEEKYKNHLATAPMISALFGSPPQNSDD